MRGGGGGADELDDALGHELLLFDVVDVCVARVLNVLEAGTLRDVEENGGVR
jgi:hypothetical protein